MPYNKPFIKLANRDLQVVKNDQNIKVAYIDALTYFHDGLCEFTTNYFPSVYRYFKHIQPDSALFHCMQVAGTALISAANIEDNTRTLRDLRNELNKNPSDKGLVALADDFIEAVIDEFIKLRA